jgi:membrane protease subunit (stomatin/prohibitin family)
LFQALESGYVINLFVSASSIIVPWFHLLEYSSEAGYFMLDYDSMPLLFYSTKSDFFLRINDIVRRAFEISKR